MNVGVAYIYCDYKGQDQTALNLVASLLRQLVQRRSVIPEELMAVYEKHKSKHTHPSLAEYSSLLQLVLRGFSQVFIVIDALDEYTEDDGTRDSFLTEIRKLQPDIHLLVTSRWVPNIEHEFEESSRLEIRASDEDVKIYLEARVVKAARLQRLVKEDPKLHDEIIETIAKNSQGMYVYQKSFGVNFVNVSNKVLVGSVTYELSSNETPSQRSSVGS
jgi:hypothetical protein